VVLKLWASDHPDFVVTFAMEGGRATGFNVRRADGTIVAVRHQ
jgi:hypothetical protein